MCLFILCLTENHCSLFRQSRRSPIIHFWSGQRCAQQSKRKLWLRPAAPQWVKKRLYYFSKMVTRAPPRSCQLAWERGLNVVKGKTCLLLHLCLWWTQTVGVNVWLLLWGDDKHSINKNTLLVTAESYLIRPAAFQPYFPWTVKAPSSSLWLVSVSLA